MFQIWRHLFGRGEGGAVGAGAVLGRGGAAGDLVGVWQRAALHLRQHTLLVQSGLEEAGVAVELHQVKDLQGGGQAREGDRDRERLD